jgi:hypothetical protein
LSLAVALCARLTLKPVNAKRLRFFPVSHEDFRSLGTSFIGLSKVRETVFDGLPITQADTPRECGVWAVDTNTGEIIGFMRFEGSVTELFEVAVLPGTHWPELVEPGAEVTNDAFVLSDDALKDVIQPVKKAD